MNSILGLGDNTFDVYLDQAKEFPGGNAVNVAVFAARLGMRAAYLGRVGEDAEGAWLKTALQTEKVETAYVQTDKQTSTAWTCVRHEAGNRVFIGSDQGASAKLVLNEAQQAYLASFAMIHTSIYSHTVKYLPAFQRMGLRVSFDFSDEWKDRFLTDICPYIEVGIISLAGSSETLIQAQLEKMLQAGAKVAIATMGADGVMVKSRLGFVKAKGEPINVVDTLGAGDGFIAGFLASYITNQSLPDATQAGIQFAEKVCQEEGGWGHARALSPDRADAILRYCESHTLSPV
ncbi:PfkB family carbohydrate kinase [Leeia sp. TBRC 13508]|uniref:PfkB family carbohydrate kinase n=1 Tax=Leeia speluncae TaxID=2884804 RepID=A0ABS8D8M1_9NEIS|nr:PfkB family carbohydrate kinase [Leeia speluncae]MCB6184574.1 PfkB family carbohydrate kinase [Leeia speluncae]